MFSEDTSVYRLWPTIVLEKHNPDISWHKDWTPTSSAEGKLDLFAPGEGNKRLRDMFNAAVDEWLRVAGAEKIMDKPRALIDAGCIWYQGGEYVPTHWHGGDLAVVYYLQSEAGVDVATASSELKQGTSSKFKSGSFVVFDPRGACNRMADAGPEHQPWLEFRPKTGTLLVFPSYLLHNTTPQRFGASRAIVAANVRFMGSQQNEQFLQDLDGRRF